MVLATNGNEKEKGNEKERESGSKEGSNIQYLVSSPLHEHSFVKFIADSVLLRDFFIPKNLGVFSYCENEKRLLRL